MFVTSYIDNAKKFNVTTAPARKEGLIEIVIETFDKITIICSQNQLRELARILSLAAEGTNNLPTQRAPRPAPAPAPEPEPWDAL